MPSNILRKYLGVYTNIYGLVPERLNSYDFSIKKKNIVILLLLLYFSSIVFLPRISGNYRYEDSLTPLLFFSVALVLTKGLIPFVIGPFLYVVYSLLVTLLYIINGTLPLEVMLIWGKEQQYVLSFVLLVGLLIRDRVAPNIINILIILVTGFGAVSGILLTLAGSRGHYGIGYFNEIYVPSLSMLMYFNLAILSLFCYFQTRRRLCLLTAIILFILVFMVGSRTGILTVLSFVTFYIFLTKVRVFAAAILTVSFVVSAFLVSGAEISELHGDLYNYKNPDSFVLEAAITRASTLLVPIETLEGSRIKSWVTLIEVGMENSPIFGCGRGCSHLRDNGDIPLGLGGDNQYTVNFVELGFVGSILFFSMLIYMATQVTRNMRKFYLSYLGAYLVCGMAMEVWQLSKGGQMFWLISALCLMTPHQQVVKKYQ